MAEGVTKCWLVSEQPEVYKDRHGIPDAVPVLHRSQLDNVMKEARETPGTSVIIYDQTCAAEKRRRRKRGKYPDPAKRVVINKAVCEGCGDCSVQSNCVSVQPVETEYGRKRRINQSMCNKDFSCLKGFCPSFVTIEGGGLKKNPAAEGGDIFASIPEPQLPVLGEHAYNVMVTGIGGTGVLTIGALMGMAAHLEGKHCRNLDMTGLAQKGGEVLSHVRIAVDREELRTGHIISGGTDLLLACDIVSAVGKVAYETLNPDRTHAVINTHNTPVAEFVTNNKVDFHNGQIRDTLMSRIQKSPAFVDASATSMALLGDEIATNIFMLGFAWQKGLVPLSRAAIERAIELNGVAIEDNKKAFNFGRLAAHDPVQVEEMTAAVTGAENEEHIAETLEEIIAKRVRYLTAYQNDAYAKRYSDMLARVQAVAPDLLETVARNYHKLLAYKDEYEVARLYTNGDFIREVKAQFEGNYKLKFNLAPPIMETTDPATGRPKKREFGPWMLPTLQMLAKFKFLRGTVFDPFGHLKDRKEERQLIADYEQTVDTVLQYVNAQNIDTAQQLLNLPDMIRGYGPVKDANIKKARAAHMRLMTDLINGQGTQKKAA
jgi:indolepyruvate ferredoxin oxidoreductase